MVNDTSQRHTSDKLYSQSNQSHHDESQTPPERNPVEIVTSRLVGAGLSTARFIDVEAGRKQSFNHDKREPREVSGNYGVYCGEGLLGVDIDDRKAWSETPETEALPETFTVSTPHGGEHRYYRVTTEVPWAINAMTGGSLNPSRQWGELYTSKYLVGPGSEIYDCKNPDCYRCKDGDPGKYEIEADLPIARISSNEIAPLLQNCSETARARQAAIAEFSEDVPNRQTSKTREDSPSASGGPFTFQLHLGEEKPADPDKRILWGIVKAQEKILSGGTV